jgi:large subunit ribosomal protein L9
MKVILLKDVPRIGRKHQVKDVPDGHALNFLIPRKLAERATPDAIKRIEAQDAKLALGKAESEHAFKDALKHASEAAATVTSGANKEGGLYKAVTVKEIVAAFKEKGVVFEEHDVHIETPIKTLGAHTARVSHGTHSGVVSFTVIPA